MVYYWVEWYDKHGLYHYAAMGAGAIAALRAEIAPYFRAHITRIIAMER